MSMLHTPWFHFKHLAALTLLSGGLWLAGCQSEAPVYNSRFLAFGTFMDLTLIGQPPGKAERIRDLLEGDFQIMHKTWHAWDPGPVPHINQALEDGRTIAAPPSVLPLIRISTELAERSDNLFNPAIGHLINTWGFQADTPDRTTPPDKQGIQHWLDAAPRMTDLEINGIHLSSSNTAVKLDFGAIGKGYGIDQAIKRLREMGVENAIVNAGGDLRAIGSRAGHPWRIAVRGPSGGGVFAIIHVSGDEAVFTSGNYERYFIWQGRKYHHIIDPRSGQPAQGTRSVTVLHPDSTTADAAATALFIAGPENWHRIAKRMGIKYVMLIDERGKVHLNPAMQARVNIQGSHNGIVISESL